MALPIPLARTSILLLLTTTARVRRSLQASCATPLHHFVYLLRCVMSPTPRDRATTGCMDSTALNYEVSFNKPAPADCEKPGCFDSTDMDHYDASATFHLPCLCTGGSCLSRRRSLGSMRALSHPGGCCPSPGASNYDSACDNPCIDTDFGCCTFTVSGCTDSRATNSRLLRFAVI